MRPLPPALYSLLLATGCQRAAPPQVTRVPVQLDQPGSFEARFALPGPSGSLLPYLSLADDRGQERANGELALVEKLAVSLELRDEEGAPVHRERWPPAPLRWGNWDLPASALILEPARSDRIPQLDPGRRYQAVLQVESGAPQLQGVPAELVLSWAAK